MKNYGYELNEYDFGSIEYSPEGNPPHNLSSITGRPKIAPNL